MNSIAVIGLDYRFPGATNPESFWHMLRNGVDAITEVPPNRWDIDSFYDPEPVTPGKTYTRWGGFLEQVDQFDANFFGISPREANKIDPQHRLLLEVSFGALENAGIALANLARSKTGVFVGITDNDYRYLNQDVSSLNAYSATGQKLCIASNRISYSLNLCGPNLALDTGCSSSLVAIHLACQSLQNKESELCLVGGVNLVLVPNGHIALSQMRMMSTDGRCKTFDASADGYVRGEGCGVVVLKRLEDALRDGDNIQAVIKGSAVNQDGLTNGLTAPNGPSQQAVVRQALERAGVKPADISYVEAHGTGTSLGDPIEVNSLKKVLMEGRDANQPCWIGSVKTNIGHLEAAAGIAGLIKVVLSLQNQEIPPHLHFKKLNPFIKIKNTPIKIPTTLQKWSAGEKPRLAGVSSFGFGGTNAHVIIEEAPIQVKTDRASGEQKSKVKRNCGGSEQNSKAKSEDVCERPRHIFTLSAKCEPALQELSGKYEEFLSNNSTATIDDVCFSANTGRSHFNHRLAIIASDKQDLADKLAVYGKQEEAHGILSGKYSTTGEPPLIAFLFTGQGSQYANMGKQLYETQPVFRQALQECEQILKAYLQESILDVLYPESAATSPINETAYTQPALFAIEYALAQLWQSWGIKPDVVMGHSVGEYVAATIAGVFSLEDGLKLISHRGRLMQQLPPVGKMLSIMSSENEVNKLIASYSEKVAIAAINGPQSIVISGEAEAIDSVKEKLDLLCIKNKQLQVSHAFHSHLMEPMLEEFGVIASEITYNKPRITLISNVTGEKADDSITTANYWVNHIRQPVNFADSMKALKQEECEVFIEIGAKPILLGMGRQCLPEDDGIWIPSLRAEQEDWQQILQSLALLYVKGIEVNWLGFDKDYSRSKVILPNYPFQRQRYWIETKQNSPKQQYLTGGKNIHPLLGEKLNFPGEQGIFASSLGEDSPAYLKMHQVFNQAVFPTTAYLEMAVAAANHQWGSGSLVVENLNIAQGLVFSTGELVNVQTLLAPSEIPLSGNQSYKLQIFSQQQQQDEVNWVLHATAKIKPHESREIPTKINLEKYFHDCNQPIDVKQHYQQFSQIGIDYGNSFQGVEKLWGGKNQALAEIKLPQELIAQTMDYQFHPALLDAALQVSFHVLPETDTDTEKTYLLVGVEEFTIYSHPGLSLYAYASLDEATTENKQSLKSSVTLVSSEGEIIASIKGLEVKLATKGSLLPTETESIKDFLYEVEWRSKGILGKLPAPDFLLKPVEIEQKLTPALRELVTQIDDNSTSFLANSLEELSVDYIVQGLLSMGWSYKLGETFEPNAAAQRLGVIPNQGRLFQRILQILSEVGILESQEQQWVVKKSLETVNPGEKSQSLLRQIPEEAATLTLLDRCASQLCGVLRGAVDPVQLVFPKGDLSTATQLYQESSAAKVMNAIVQKTITQATEKLPANRGIRLLEIGAGTGGTTSYILPHLNPNQTQYTFTDIGTLFTAKAQEKFRDYKFLEYETLDIEVDPATQGFESHQYDVIIAANVLHATADIKQTLSHVKQLLAPGGILVLYETTSRSRWLDLIFGLLEGWWKFQDNQLRPDYPLLTRNKWKEVLLETGYTEALNLPEIEETPQILSQQAVIVAKAPESDSNPSTSQNWLLFADEQGIAQQLAKQLNSQGDICTLVFAGDEYKQITPTEFTINPNNPSEYEQLIGKLATELPAINGVVQCWSTESGVAANVNAEELEKLSQLGCGSTLSLVKALVKGELSQLPRLWLVTCGSQAVPSSNLAVPGVTQSSLWGMGKVISLEHPELNCSCIDLDPQQTLETQATALFNEVCSGDKEDQVALRADSRYVARLIPSSLREETANTDKQKPLNFRSDATYLITGGTGGLGLLVANWMVSKGAKNLVLVGRSSLKEATKKKLAELEMAGASVVLETADVSDTAAMTRVLQNIEKSQIPLAGIIHSAGMLSDGVLLNQTWSNFEKVMAAKVQGAWNLHQLTQNHPLDFFVLFSSIASLLGSPGQANHSAANSFLDALAHYRRAMGLPGLSLHWGVVSQVGEAAERGTDARVSKQGLGVISPAQVLQSLELVMSSCGTEDNEIGIVPIDWSAWQERVIKWSFLSDWQEISQKTAQTSGSEFLLKLEAAKPKERRPLLVAHVRRQLSLVLGINDLESISLETGFFDLGMDSLTSVELRNKLQTTLDCSIPSTLAFDYPTIGKLVDYLAQQFNLTADTSDLPSETLPTESQEDSQLSNITELSEFELEASLLQEIEELQKLI